jgi:hypothetical protein
MRPVAGGEQVEIGVADAGDHGLVALDFCDQSLGQLGSIERGEIRHDRLLVSYA